MPAWWRGKSKSTPSSGSRKKEEAAAAAAVATAKTGSKPSKKEKAKSFDEAVARKNVGGLVPGGGRTLFTFDPDGERRCHPLPPPLISDPMATPGSGSASASVSSVSSSGTDETPDLGIYRYSEPVSTPRGRSAVPNFQGQQPVTEDRTLFSCSPVLEYERLSISPRREFLVSVPDSLPIERGYSHCRVPTETMCSPRSRSPGPGTRGYNPSTSPIHLRAFCLGPDSPAGKPDDMKSPPHPLPLPPGSPTSSTSRPLQSQWKKGKLLGRGTFGHVFLGFNSDNGQMCAIKEVKVISDDSNSKECLKQLAQEITLLSQLSHPNIVQYHGSELAEDTLSVYLEYVSGGSIHKLLQEYGPFREPVIRSYAAQILSGLAYLHGRNTVHRDIKGANILVDPNGEIKLADFGMAKHMSSHTSIRSFKGSPYWMAPEVIMNTGGYNLSVDVWSLGCTILEMATSKPPWCQYEGVAAIFKIGNSKDTPEIPDHLSNDGKNFLKLCLQRDPSARPTAAQLMDHPFVRDQATIKIARSSIVRDAFPSSYDGTHTPTTSEFPYNRSISPLHDRDYPMRHTIACSPFPKSPSDLVSMRMMSLPVSPCSSPLRSFRQPTWSCFPSPPHPAYPLGTINGGLSDFSLNPLGPSKKYLDTRLNISQARSPNQPSTPRRHDHGGSDSVYRDQWQDHVF